MTLYYDKIIPLRDAFTQFNSSYSNLGADYSVTELIKPPRIVQLKKRYADIINARPINIEKQIAAFEGTALHHEFEHNLKLYSTRNPESGYFVERRLWDIIKNRKVSGQFDTYLEPLQTIYDFKSTKVWKKIYGDFSDWIAQLNIYHLFLRYYKKPVKKIKIIAWWTNWDKNNVWKPNYPEYKIEELDLGEPWDEFTQKEYLEACVESHIANELLSDNQLWLCSSKDRWEKDTVYKVFKYKNGNPGKRASYTTKREYEAYEYMHEKVKKLKKGEEYKSIFYPGEWMRCKEWCDVAEFCNQYQEHQGYIS